MNKQKSSQKATRENHVLAVHNYFGRANKRFAQDFSGETKTQQHQAEGLNVNNIVAAYDRTGVDPYAERLARQRFGDGTYRTYLEVMNLVADARSEFEHLPQSVRDEYGHVEAYIDAQWEASLQPPEPTPEPAPEPSQEPQEASTPVEKDAD